MSDSCGLQEEAVSMGKPIIILRENTERPEAVKSGCAFISGVSFNKIYYYASSLLSNIELYKIFQNLINIWKRKFQYYDFTNNSKLLYEFSNKFIFI